MILIKSRQFRERKQDRNNAPGDYMLIFAVGSFLMPWKLNWNTFQYSRGEFEIWKIKDESITNWRYCTNCMELKESNTGIRIEVDVKSVAKSKWRYNFKKYQTSAYLKGSVNAHAVKKLAFMNVLKITVLDIQNEVNLRTGPMYHKVNAVSTWPMRTLMLTTTLEVSFLNSQMVRSKILV